MRRAAFQVGASAIVGAVATYVIQFLGARWLGPADFARFSVFWAILFVIVGALVGVSQEVIRVSRLAKLREDSGLPPLAPTSRHPRIAVVALAVGACAAGAVFASGLLWGPSAFGSEWVWSLLLLTLAAILVGSSLAGGATLAGLGRWGGYSLFVILENVARLAFFVIVALVGSSVLGFSTAAVLAYVVVLAALLIHAPLRRGVFSIRSDVPTGPTMARMLNAMAATGLSAAMTIGMPALLSAAVAADPRGMTPQGLGVLILLVTLTRAPIMVPLTASQNVLIARFTGADPASLRRSVLLGSGVTVAGSAVLAALAALVGPPLLPVLFGPSYTVGPWLVAGLTLAVAGLGIITLTGIVAMSLARHRLYVLGWGVSITVAAAVLFVAPLPFEWATVVALGSGPLVGAAVQIVALLRPRR